MASMTDPRAAGFDPVAFRSAITFAMTMGLPDNAPDRATFYWNASSQYSTHDTAGNPYDWTASPVEETTHPSVQIPVATEFGEASGIDGTAMGEIDESKAKLTVLDTNYAQVVGADYFTLGQRRYDIKNIEPPQGLFGVTIYIIHGQALDA